ncbi:MAG: HD domain-containing protein [Geobacteraceae bacterium]|nr:HD domain-containing protein [Geobacteraceae bacterium]
MIETLSGELGELKLEEKRLAILQIANHSMGIVSLDTPQVIIGRSAEVDLHINDTYISKIHARILALHNSYYIEDLSSRNGTMVNGEPVKRALLANKDVISLGRTNMRFIQMDTIDENYIKKLNLQMIQSLALAVEAKDPYTKGHSERVAELSEKLAATMGYLQSEVERVRIAGILHDIGKIGVSEVLLGKKEKLEESEYELVKLHSMEGRNILKPLFFLNDILPAIYHHHERFDGKGYPEGLSGKDIPLWARIIQVADTYAAMTSDRPYRPALTDEQAIKEITNSAGTQLDPVISHVLVKIIKSK